jgi:hypothetical protein
MTNTARFPFVAIPEFDLVDGPNGPQRVRQLLKQLGRQYRIKIEWMPSNAGDLPSGSLRRSGDRSEGESSSVEDGGRAGVSPRFKGSP